MRRVLEVDTSLLAGDEIVQLIAAIQKIISPDRFEAMLSVRELPDKAAPANQISIHRRCEFFHDTGLPNTSVARSFVAGTDAVSSIGEWLIKNY